MGLIFLQKSRFPGFSAKMRYSRRKLIELAINSKYNNSLYFKALYDHHVKDISATNNPGCPSFYSMNFFQNIKTAAEGNSVEDWSSKQWYSYLIDRDVLCEEIRNNDGTSWETIKCAAETTFPEYNWEETWYRARMPGLSNEVRSMFWRFLHNLLPTQSRLHRLKMSPEPTCLSCDTAESDHAWYHTFTKCPAMKSVRDWLSNKLNLLNVFYESIEKAMWLQFPLVNDDAELLPAVWLVRKTLTHAWARRKNREDIDIRALNAVLTINANYLRKSTKFGECGETVHQILLM